MYLHIFIHIYVYRDLNTKLIKTRSGLNSRTRLDFDFTCTPIIASIGTSVRGIETECGDTLSVILDGLTKPEPNDLYLVYDYNLGSINATTFAFAFCVFMAYSNKQHFKSTQEDFHVYKTNMNFAENYR
ncbi:hypothetical protein GQX74_000108 [Glossina fuscipes]|nr:hypothetical protein GQX74_000108 [Glossina fuscipes]